MPKCSSCQDDLLICNLTYLGQSMTLTLSDLKSKLPSNLSGSQSIWVDPPRREKDDSGKFIALSQIAKKLLTKTLTKLTSRKTKHFCLTWPGRSTADLNRSTRTPLDLGRPKLSVGLCRGALTHSRARWRGGGGWQRPPLRCVLVPRKRRCGRGLKLRSIGLYEMT